MQISVICVWQGYRDCERAYSINKISIVMIVGKFKIMRSGPKAVTVVYFDWLEGGGKCGVGGV